MRPRTAEGRSAVQLYRGTAIVRVCASSGLRWEGPGLLGLWSCFLWSPQIIGVLPCSGPYLHPAVITLRTGPRTTPGTVNTFSVNSSRPPLEEFRRSLVPWMRVIGNVSDSGYLTSTALCLPQFISTPLAKNAWSLSAVPTWLPARQPLWLLKHLLVLGLALTASGFSS